MELGRTTKEQNLIEWCYDYQSQYFEDMTFSGGITQKYTEMASEWYDNCDSLLPDIDNLSYIYIDELPDGVGGEYHLEEKAIIISPEYAENKAVILHELIHFYEYSIRDFNTNLSELLLLELYKDLSKKIDNLDDMIADRLDAFYLFEKVEKDGGRHGLLFYLKSLDLDLRCGYKLETIFGYGYAEE